MCPADGAARLSRYDRFCPLANVANCVLRYVARIQISLLIHPETAGRKNFRDLFDRGSYMIGRGVPRPEGHQS